jgi:hypothetical protein
VTQTTMEELYEALEEYSELYDTQHWHIVHQGTDIIIKKETSISLEENIYCKLVIFDVLL